MKLNGQAPGEVVRRGYDRIGARYLQWRRTIRATAAFVNRALQGLPQDGWALDLGCGPGLPVTEALARRGRVVGVDLSATQLSWLIATLRRHGSFRLMWPRWHSSQGASTSSWPATA